MFSVLLLVKGNPSGRNADTKYSNSQYISLRNSNKHLIGFRKSDQTYRIFFIYVYITSTAKKMEAGDGAKIPTTG